MNIPIIYEDDWLVVLNKPSGLLSVPAPKKECRTLEGILNDDLIQKGVTYRLHPCHRLDRETSGLIIFAKGKAAQQKIMELFQRREIKKTYIAFAQGVLSKGQDRISSLIEGQGAVTQYRVIERRGNFSLVEVVPLTGRTNQIRIHFKRIGHPIVGEAKFAFRRDFKLKAKRLCLHARDLSFLHPFSKKKLSLHAGLAPDLEDFLKKNV